MNKEKLQKYFNSRYYTTIFEVKDGARLIIAFPLRKRDRYFDFSNSVYFVFPDDDREMRRMISAKSLVYFEEEYMNFKFNCTFSVVDDKAIVFARKVLENYKDEISDYLFKCLPKVKEAHNKIFLSSAEDVIKDMIKEQNKSGIFNP